MLSLCIANWDRPGQFVAKPARECSREELRSEVWQQLQLHLARCGLALADGDLVSWYLADSIVHHPDGKVDNREPLLINDHVRVTTDRAVLRARVVVAADGSNSTVRQKLGWRDPAHLAQLLEVLTPVHGRGAAELSRDGVALFEFGVVAGGVSGYYWDFPCSVGGQPAINRGVYALPVALSRQKRPLKAALADSLAARQLCLADWELRGHPVRTFNPEGRLCTTRILLVGDAAGVDPMYAEGISFAPAYGEAAAASIASAFTRGRFDFVDYPRRVRAHALLGQLPARVRLARWGSHLRDPRALDLLWRLGARALKLTRWDDRGYVPAADEHARILRA